MKKSNKWPKVSVVMSNYNGYTLKLIPKTLSSILENNYPNLEIILVDNSSTDKSVEVIRESFQKNEKFKLIQNHVNIYSQGLNLGIKNSTGKYVAFFNNDVVVSDGYFQKFIKFLEKNHGVALSQGKLLSYFDHKVIDSAGETMDEFGNPITIGAGLDAEKNFNKRAEVLSVSGSCSIVRREIMDKIGFFDNDYGIGYEDMDLGLRVWLSGNKVVYYPDVFAYHMRGVTDTSKMVKAQVRWHFNKNRIATLIKNYPVEFLIRNLPVTLMIYLLAGFWEIIIKKNSVLGMKRFTSIFWVISNFFSILRKRSVIQKNIHKKGLRRIEELLYKKTLFQSFGSFIKAR